MQTKNEDFRVGYTAGFNNPDVACITKGRTLEYITGYRRGTFDWTSLMAANVPKTAKYFTYIANRIRSHITANCESYVFIIDGEYKLSYRAKDISARSPHSKLVNVYSDRTVTKDVKEDIEYTLMEIAENEQC